MIGQGRGQGAIRRPGAPVGEGARDADGGRRTTGSACPVRRGTELGAEGRAVARGCEDRAEGHRRGRGHCLEVVSAHTSPHWRKPPKRRQTRPRAHDWEARTSRSAGPACGYPRSTLRRVHEARSVGRVPRSAQHAGVGRIERRATIDERHDVVERQVTRRMRRMLGTIAWADVAVLADVAGDHPLGQASPSRIRVEVMVGTDARQARMLAAASSRSARDDAADRAELHDAGRLSAWSSGNAAPVPSGDARSHARRHLGERARRRRWGLFACGATPPGPSSGPRGHDEADPSSFS